MSRSQSTGWLWLGVFALQFAVGCGKASDVVPISGHVSYQRSPLARGVLMFHPERGRAIAAVTDGDGKYRIGLPPGEYAVTVNVGVQLPPGWKEGDPVPPQTITIPSQYTTRINTPLKTTVSASGAEPTDFVLP